MTVNPKSIIDGQLDAMRQPMSAGDFLGGLAFRVFYSLAMRCKPARMDGPEERAATVRQRVEQLEAKLKAHGIDP
jgi:hypothetical protein